MATVLPDVAAGSVLVAPTRRRRYGLVAAAVTLLVCVLVSLVVGSKPIAVGDVVDVLLGGGGREARVIVLEQRVPRTVLAVLVGIALAVAGGLMQGMTRNPLADPGLLGVNAGAAFAMALAVAFLPGVAGLGLVGCAFLGALATTLLVYVVGATGRAGASPISLLLAGVAIAAVLSGITTLLALLDPVTFNVLRFWSTGALDDRGWAGAGSVVPFLVVGLATAAASARGLNAVALGDDLAAALGAHVVRTRLCVVAAVTLLCGSATAAVGSLVFVGLMVPHVSRWITGADQRWILAYCTLLGPILVLVADIVGRVVVRPGEIPAGVLTAVIGGPVLIVLVRRSKASAL